MDIFKTIQHKRKIQENRRSHFFKSACCTNQHLQPLNMSEKKNSHLLLSFRLNERGICLLDRGSYKEAAHSFTKAFHYAKQSMLNREESHDQLEKIAEAATMELKDHHLSTEPLPPVASLQSNATADFLQCDTKHHEYNIFTTPMHIADLFDRHKGDCATATCVAAIYNFALVCQLTAMRGNSPWNGLHAAVQLFENAQVLYVEEEVEIGLVFELGILNNLGQAHRMLDNKVKADQYFKYMMNCIVFLNVCGRQRQVKEAFPEVFFGSFSYLILKDSAAPAA
jgi:tetratricopeptide (TPR) repeat protein